MLRPSRVARGALKSLRAKLANVDWQNLGVDSEWSRLRIFNADGHFAKDISRDVGPSGRRAIHGHGPLLWHL